MGLEVGQQFRALMTLAGSGFDSKHQYGDLGPSIIPDPGDPTPSSDFEGGTGYIHFAHVYMIINRLCTHIKDIQNIVQMLNLILQAEKAFGWSRSRA